MPSNTIIISSLHITKARCGPFPLAANTAKVYTGWEGNTHISVATLVTTQDSLARVVINVANSYRPFFSQKFKISFL